MNRETTKFAGIACAPAPPGRTGKEIHDGIVHDVRVVALGIAVVVVGVIILRQKEVEVCVVSSLLGS